MSNTSLRILITRLSAIGDCVMTLPMVCAIRQRYPNAFIAWAVQSAGAKLLEGHPAIDQLVIVPKKWLRNPSNFFRLRKELRALKCPTVIDPQSLTKSSLLAWISGAKERIGFDRSVGREIAPWLNNVRVTGHTQHLIDRQLELLRPLGIHQPTVEFRLPEKAADTEFAEQYIRQAHLGCGFVAINPGAGWDSRLWPTDRFGQVARHLGENRGVPSLVVWAGDREKKFAEEIVAGSGGHAILAPNTSLTQVVALLRRAKMYLGSDTGPMHMAVATGTPCVVLHGTTRPENSGAYGPAHIAVQAWYQGGSSRQRRKAQNLAMRDIHVPEVCEACDQQLARKNARVA